MSIDLTNPIFHDENAARAHLEKQRWPNGPVCPHCNSKDVMKLSGEKHRQGLYQCRNAECREQFSVTVGTVMERSHIPLAKWVLAIQLMAASKKGVSAKQIERTLGVTYRTAWFVMHRIREAMAPAADGEPGTGPIGGEGKTVESDETFVGGKKKNVHRGKPEPKKHVSPFTQSDGLMITASDGRSADGAAVPVFVERAVVLAAVEAEARGCEGAASPDCRSCATAKGRERPGRVNAPQGPNQ